MCFYNGDCDLTYSVCEEDVSTAAEPFRCQECHRHLPTGAVRHDLYLQEHEECRACDEDECSCAEGKCCQCSTPSIGKSEDFVRCGECDKFLKAVQASEEEEGCAANESSPPLGFMIERISDSDGEDKRRYIKKAIAMFPELKTTGYITFIARRIC